MLRSVGDALGNCARHQALLDEAFAAQVSYLSTGSWYQHRHYNHLYFADTEKGFPPSNADALARAEISALQPLSFRATSWTAGDDKFFRERVRYLMELRLSNELVAAIPPEDWTSRKDELDAQLRQIHEKPDCDLIPPDDTMRSPAMDSFWKDVELDCKARLGFSAAEFRLRWLNHASCHLRSNEPWTAAEDKDLLKVAAKHHFMNWKAIAKDVNSGRSAVDLLRRYQTRWNSALQKSKWSEADDQELLNAVELFGDGNWVEIAHFLGHRQAIQCLHRYNKNLRPGLRHHSFSREEDKLLLLGVHAYGTSQWSKIRKYCFSEARFDTALRERHVNVLGRGFQVRPWTDAENDRLLSYVDAHGPGRWVIVAKAAMKDTRSAVQCWKQWRKLRKTEAEQHVERVMLSRTYAHGRSRHFSRKRKGDNGGSSGGHDDDAEDANDNSTLREQSHGDVEPCRQDKDGSTSAAGAEVAESLALGSGAETHVVRAGEVSRVERLGLKLGVGDIHRVRSTVSYRRNDADTGSRTGDSGDAGDSAEGFSDSEGEGEAGVGGARRAGPSRRIIRRVRFSESEVVALESYFRKDSYPSSDEIRHLARRLSTSIVRIRRWFQRARNKVAAQQRS